MSTLRTAPLLAALTLACADGGADSAATVCVPDAPAGTLQGTLDGAPWSAAASWAWTGESLQITTENADEWRLTIVAHRDAGGQAPAAAAEADALPLTIDLGADDGWATVYPAAGGTSLTSKQGSGGTLTLTTLGDASGSGTVEGCLDFGAASATGDGSARFEGGSFQITAP